MKKLFEVRTIILAGSLLLQLNTLCFHARGAAGDVDLSFDPGSGVNGRVTSLVTQPDGKLLVGSTPAGDFNSCAMARLNADGSDDGSFNHIFTGWNSSLALQPDGKVLAVGDFQVNRFNADGSQDNSFHPDLTVVTYPTDCGGYGCWGYTAPTVVLAQADGKVLIGGYKLTMIVYDLEGDNYPIEDDFLAWFNANGSLDRSLIGGTANSLVQQPDGKLLIGSSGGIYRLNSDGSVDNSFNPGTVANGGALSIALQLDGKVLIGGHFTAINGTTRNKIARLNANGSLDTSFNPITGAYDAVQSLAIQSDGKVLIAGTFQSINGTNHETVVRLKANGSLDTSFRSPSLNSYVMKVALQPDGNVLIGGEFSTVNGVVRGRVARLYGDSVAPSLHIARSNAFVILSWPVTGLNFQLQESTNLSLPNSWSPVAQPAVTNASQISVTVPTTVGRKFFRLKSQ
jgi:uncharacterized delta-60 repeat protein